MLLGFQGLSCAGNKLKGPEGRAEQRRQRLWGQSLLDSTAEEPVFCKRKGNHQPRMGVALENSSDRMIYLARETRRTEGAEADSEGTGWGEGEHGEGRQKGKGHRAWRHGEHKSRSFEETARRTGGLLVTKEGPDLCWSVPGCPPSITCIAEKWPRVPRVSRYNRARQQAVPEGLHTVFPPNAFF